MSEPVFSIPDYQVGNFYSALSNAPVSWAMGATFIDQMRLMGCDGEGEEVGDKARGERHWRQDHPWAARGQTPPGGSSACIKGRRGFWDAIAMSWKDRP